MFNSHGATNGRVRVKNFAWIVWILAALFFLCEYFARVAPSVMVPDLMRYFHVCAFALGSLSAFFYYAYIAMQLPVGALVDRFGPHRLLTCAAALCGLSVILFSHTHNILCADFARLIMGFSAAFAFVGVLKLATAWFPLSMLGLIAGATQALGMLGAAIGEGPVSILVHHFGWRFSMHIIGFTLLILALLIGLVVRDKPKDPLLIQPKPKQNAYSILYALKAIFSKSQTWINGIFVGFLYAPTAAFAELWGASYLHHVYSINAEMAANAISMIFIGWAIGGPIIGWFSDHIGKRKPIMIVSAILSLIFLATVLYVPHLSVICIYLLLFLYGVSNVAVSTSYVVAAEIVPKRIAGTSMAFANMCSILIGACLQLVIGYLLDLQWGHQFIHHVPLYTAENYRYAMLVLPVCFVVSIVAGCLLKESCQKR